jgi:hypothetical protein
MLFVNGGTFDKYVTDREYVTEIDMHHLLHTLNLHTAH